MRRLTAIILPFSLALATGAFASSADVVAPSPATIDVDKPTIARSTVRPTAPPDVARRRSLSPEQQRAIAARLDRMTPRMRQALLGRLAKMSDTRDGEQRVRRAGPSTNRDDGDRRELRDRRSGRDAGKRSRSKIDRSRRGVDRAGVRGSQHDRRSVDGNAGDAVRGDARRVRTGKKARDVKRKTDEIRRSRDQGPRLHRADESRPDATDRKRSSPSERRRRD
ncbi:MAG: hypothetical protein ACYSUU_04520 [Planctomycetota bacterium]